MDIELALDCAPGVACPHGDPLVEAARQALVAGGCDPEPGYELSVRLVDTDESAELNGRYRAKPYATNVLSFPADARLPGLVVLGDLVICMPVLETEASVQGKSVDAHLTHMMIHGVLHLLGHDHIGDDEALCMESLERRAMAALGHADPYR